MNKKMNYLPQAYITKGKKRLKQFEYAVYLNDGDNYEIELFNPTKKSVLAKIQLDGEYISNGGIVVRPGERIFLERFLDTNNRFVFNTYNVDNDSPIINEAIKNNGNVRIEFYNQSSPHWFGGTTYTTGYPTIYTNTPYNPIITFYNYSNNSVNSSNTSNFNLPISDSLETGRTEKGEESNQSFVNTNQTFEYFVMNSITWKILPNSEQVYTQKDLKRYCGDCGAKIKKSAYKFCPHCGSELD